MLSLFPLKPRFMQVFYLPAERAWPSPRAGEAGGVTVVRVTTRSGHPLRMRWQKKVRRLPGSELTGSGREAPSRSTMPTWGFSLPQGASSEPWSDIDISRWASGMASRGVCDYGWIQKLTAAPVAESALLRPSGLAAGVYSPVHVSCGARRGPADLGRVAALAGMLRFENQTVAARVGLDSAVRRRHDHGHGIVQRNGRLAVIGPEATSSGRDRPGSSGPWSQYDDSHDGVSVPGHGCSPPHPSPGQIFGRPPAAARTHLVVSDQFVVACGTGLCADGGLFSHGATLKDRSPIPVSRGSRPIEVSSTHRIPQINNLVVTNN